MFTAKYNRSTQHIDGLAVRTESTGGEKGGVVAYYAENACAALTRSGRNMATGKGTESAAKALKDAEASARAAGRKMCKTCRAAAFAMMLDEAYAENEARYEVAREQADAEQVVDFRIEIIEPDANLDVRSPLGRRYPTELRLDLTGPELEVFVPRDEDDEAFALEVEPEGFGVYDAEDEGRLYWTMPLLEVDEAKTFLREIADEAARVVAGTTFDTWGGFELTKAAQDATDRIALRCAQLAH